MSFAVSEIFVTSASSAIVTPPFELLIDNLLSAPVVFVFEFAESFIPSSPSFVIVKSPDFDSITPDDIIPSFPVFEIAVFPVSVITEPVVPSSIPLSETVLDTVVFPFLLKIFPKIDIFSLPLLVIVKLSFAVSDIFVTSASSAIVIPPFVETSLISVSKPSLISFALRANSKSLFPSLVIMVLPDVTSIWLAINSFPSLLVISTEPISFLIAPEISVFVP